MKQKMTRLTSVLLAVIMLLSVVVVPVSATETFKDVPADKWYSETKVHRMKTLTPPGEPEPPTMEELAFGGANKNLLKLISPISLVHKDIPPTMIQQGAEDSVVHYYNSTLLAERIEQVCGPERVHLVLYPDRNHSDKGFMTKENCLEVLAFFDKYLK